MVGSSSWAGLGAGSMGTRRRCARRRKPLRLVLQRRGGAASRYSVIMPRAVGACRSATAVWRRGRDGIL